MSSSEETRSHENDVLSVNSRLRSKLSREIVLVLLIKLALIIAIKLVFFNDPVSKIEVTRRMDAVFSSTQTAQDPRTSSDSQR